MLGTLIQSKTRLKLILRFFLNPESSAYLRGLAEEFDESTNSVRIELNRFEEAGLIKARKEGNKKIYQVNTKFPMFQELQGIAFKHFGIDKIIEQITAKLGEINSVYLTGDLARGLETSIIDLTIIGDNIDTAYLAKLISKAEKMIDKRIRTLVYDSTSSFEMEKPYLLVFGDENQIVQVN